MAPSSTLRPASSASWRRRVSAANRCKASVERARLRRRPARIDAQAGEVRRELLAERHAAAPRQGGLGQADDADAIEPLQLEHAAGARGHGRRPGVRRAHQRRRDRRLLRVEAARALAEQGLRQRIDADDLAAERHRVEVGLEDLALLPRRLEPGRGHRLAELLGDAAAAGRARQAVVEQAGELHRQGRCAARARVDQVAPGAPGRRAPVDAAVLPEAPVLAQDDRRQQRRRHLGERHPGEAAHVLVDPQRLDRHAVAVEQGDVGGPVRRLHRGEARQRAPQPRIRARRDRAASASSERGDATRVHGPTSMAAFGVSPKLSGAYIASTRVGGSANLPGLLRRTLYSTTCLPRGRYS